MADVTLLQEQIKNYCGDHIIDTMVDHDELTVEISPAHLKKVCVSLRDEPMFGFNMLMDVAGVDYLEYGLSEWHTEETTKTGFDRGVCVAEKVRINPSKPARFASVYHLFSVEHNHRVRLRVFMPESLKVDSVVDIWPSANWYEREAFDLFGFLYVGHPDLRRILTDYGFVGHPFRKDFPISGHVEVRYDATLQRVIYEPVDIEPRVLVPKIIRKDNRYLDEAMIREKEEIVKKELAAQEAAKKAAEAAAQEAAKKSADGVVKT
jgi:NADH-quinone oxidoreductase subunit C